jgi:hypothetical protein
MPDLRDGDARERALRGLRFAFEARAGAGAGTRAGARGAAADAVAE